MYRVDTAVGTYFINSALKRHGIVLFDRVKHTDTVRKSGQYVYLLGTGLFIFALLQA